MKQIAVNHIWNPEHRRVASKLRIGNHNVKIETGRFTIPKTLEDLRICDHCNLNSVENEMHIFHCDIYDDLRKTLLKSTSKIHYLQITQNGNTEENLLLLVRKFGNLCIKGILALRKSSVRSTSVRMSILYVSWGEILNFNYLHILVVNRIATKTFRDKKQQQSHFLLNFNVYIGVDIRERARARAKITKEINSFE